MNYKSFDPQAKVIGQSMLGFRAAIDKDIIEPLLLKHGLGNIQADQWYPMQPWLDVLSEIDKYEDKIANMLTFVDIGRKVASNVYIPEDVEQFIKKEGCIEFMSQFGAAIYFRDHQGYVGEYAIEKINDQYLKFSFRTPYPPDFLYGVIHGFASRYCTAPFLVKYEDLAMRNYNHGKPVIIHVVVNQ